jgi:ribosomal protein L16/L10AE
VTKNQIESCRKIISRFSRRFKPRPKYKLYFNYSILLTKKSLGARMGRGKGAVKGYYAKVCKNDLLFGFNNCKAYVIRTLINRLKYKMPFKLKLVSLFKNGYCRSEDRCR